MCPQPAQQPKDTPVSSLHKSPAGTKTLQYRTARSFCQASVLLTGHTHILLLLLHHVGGVTPVEVTPVVVGEADTSPVWRLRLSHMRFGLVVVSL